MARDSIFGLATAPLLRSASPFHPVFVVPGAGFAFGAPASHGTLP
jgi:hypothetical protein